MEEGRRTSRRSYAQSTHPRARAYDGTWWDPRGSDRRRRRLRFVWRSNSRRTPPLVTDGRNRLEKGREAERTRGTRPAATDTWMGGQGRQRPAGPPRHHVMGGVGRACQGGGDEAKRSESPFACGWLTDRARHASAWVGGGFTRSRNRVGIRCAPPDQQTPATLRRAWEHASPR